jgi:two-component system, NtrC family, sensor histidine kinase HydH
MDREITASTKIVSDLLDFARERTPNLRPCPLRPLVAEAIELLAPHSSVTISNEVPEALPIPSLDKDQFRQVVVNLLQNAIEASSEGGEVKIKAEGGADAPWRIVVSDNGPGIASDVAAKVFQPLFTTKTKGTGLGLAIVSNAVARHEGTIRVESKLGEGATFVIELPQPRAG